MKLDIYSEKYNTQEVKHAPEKLGSGSLEAFSDVSKAAINVAAKFMEQSDELNSGKIYADTVLAADKLINEYKANTTADTTEEDIANTQRALQDVIQQNSKRFKTAGMQTRFVDSMAKQVELPYMQTTIKYGQAVNVQQAIQNFENSGSQLAALIAQGDSLVNFDDVVKTRMADIESIGKLNNIPVVEINKQKQDELIKLVGARAQWALKNDPKTFKQQLIGEPIAKFIEYKQSQGQTVTIEQFYSDPVLQEEFKNSDYGIDYNAQYNTYAALPWEVRSRYLIASDEAIERLEKQEEQQRFLQNTSSEFDLNTEYDAAKTQIGVDGKDTLSQTLTKIDLGGPSSSSEIKFGKAGTKYIDKSKGHYATKQAQTFADAIAGTLTQMGIHTELSSSVRPEYKTSQHRTGKAVDIVPLHDGKVTVKSLVEAYATAIKLYPDKIRKNSVLFEVHDAELKQIKTMLKERGLDTSYINWEQSAKYGNQRSANEFHLHFGIDPNADYTKATETATNEVYLPEWQAKFYNLYRSQGKSATEAMEKVREKALDYKIAKATYYAKYDMVHTKEANGQLLNPSKYGEYIQAQYNAISNNRNMPAEERLVRLKALNALKGDIPALQASFKDDQLGFIQETNPGLDRQSGIKLQSQYGIDPHNMSTLTKAEAEMEAASIKKLDVNTAFARLSKMSPMDMKQLEPYLGDTKYAIMQYGGIYSPSLTQAMIRGLQNYDIIDQMQKEQKGPFAKKGGINWQDRTASLLRSNAFSGAYIKNLEKTDPIQAKRFIQAMTGVIMIKAAQVGDEANFNDIVKDVVKESLGKSYTSVNVGKQGTKTQVLIHNSLTANPDNQVKITTMLNSALSMGLNPYYLKTDELKVDKMLKDANITEADKQYKQLKQQFALKSSNEAIKLSTLQTSSDGLSATFVRKGTKQDIGIDLKSTGGNPFTINLVGLPQLYNEAEALIPKIQKRGQVSKSTAVAIARYGASTAPLLTVNEARQIAQKEVLKKYYPWLNAKSSNTETGRAANLYGFDYKGNIDLFNRPEVKNADGSISTVRSISYTAEIDGEQKYILIPTVSDDGKIMSPKEAIKYWSNKQQHLGIYNTRKEADEAAQQIHIQQQDFYLGE